jgi:hypothetical protein
MDKVQNKKIVSVNFSCAVFCLLSPFDDLAIKTLVWRHVVQYNPIQFGVVWFGSVWSSIEQSSLVWSFILEFYTSYN